jgi:hypothetical protein
MRPRGISFNFPTMRNSAVSLGSGAICVIYADHRRADDRASKRFLITYF